MKFEIEKAIIHHETQPLRVVPDEERIVREIDELLAKPENLLGDGKTAEVRTMSGNELYCMKIVDDERLNALYGSDDHPIYNDEEVEFKLLELAHSISGKVKVPRPFLAWKIHTQDGRKIGVIVMERLKAVSLKQVHEGAKLPETFNINSFFSDLQNYLEKLHADLGIHHRDIAEGNILVDQETGQPCLVDFGDSAKAFDEENPYTIRDDFGRVIRHYPSDRKALSNVRKNLAVLPQLTNNLKSVL